MKTPLLLKENFNTSAVCFNSPLIYSNTNQ